MLSASKILIKRSSTPGSVPTSNQLEPGELALNLEDKKIFFKNTENNISSIEDSPFTFLENLSSIEFKVSSNNVTGAYSGILGGYNNDVSGSGSTTINGENNDITGDFALIGNGLNNTIGIDGDYSVILGGKNNTLNHQESFILGSNITSHLSGFTYVNNLSVLGKIYGDGSELNGVTGSGGSTDTEVRALTSNWESTYTTVQTYSGSWEASDIIDLTFKTAYTTYYHELQYDSATSNLSAVQIYEDNTKITHLFEKLLTYTSTALLTGILITDKVNNNTLTKTLTYDVNGNLISTTRIYT